MSGRDDDRACGLSSFIGCDPVKDEDRWDGTAGVDVEALSATPMALWQAEAEFAAAPMAVSMALFANAAATFLSITTLSLSSSDEAESAPLIVRTDCWNCCCCIGPSFTSMSSGMECSRGLRRPPLPPPTAPVPDPLLLLLDRRWPPLNRRILEAAAAAAVTVSSEGSGSIQSSPNSAPAAAAAAADRPSVHCDCSCSAVDAAVCRVAFDAWLYGAVAAAAAGDGLVAASAVAET